MGTGQYNVKKTNPDLVRKEVSPPRSGKKKKRRDRKLPREEECRSSSNRPHLRRGQKWVHSPETPARPLADVPGHYVEDVLCTDTSA